MGTLYLVSTPIGNLEDITIRALKMLFSVDYIACEDTRVTGQLLTSLSNTYTLINQSIEVKKPKLISFYDEVEEQKTPEILALLESGKLVALVSDSGTPLVSDPGYRLVRSCIKKNINIVPVPGPSALITALTVSGLPTDKFLFVGYLPSHQSKRVKLLKYILSHTLPSTIILYESPHRLRETLIDIQTIFGDIDIILARELTKVHEEVYRGSISTLLPDVTRMKGELVLLFNIPPK